MTEVSTLRLNILRAMYLLIAVGLGSIMWPRIISHGTYEHMQGVGFSLFAALAALAALGIRYPLQMLPLLLFEILWKSIWLISIALPLWRADALDAAHASSVFDCLFGVIITPLAIPWKYVYHNYVKKPGDRWKGSATAAAPNNRPT